VLISDVIPYYTMNGVLALGAVVLLTLAVAAYCRGKLSGNFTEFNRFYSVLGLQIKSNI